MPKARKTLYIARDIERALGSEPGEDYRIATNRTPYAEEMKKRWPQFVHLTDSQKGFEDTAELMASDHVRRLIADTGSDIVVFKSNPRIEAIAKENGWTLLNPPSALAEKVENKITQVEWLGELVKYLPAHSVGAAKGLKWNKEPLVIQWAHGHTGDSTMLVNSAQELKAVQEKFPDRPARASAFVRGPSFTVNAVVTKDSVLVGNVSYQITGLPPFTDNPFTTIGNDWSLTHSLLDESEISYIETMAREIGGKLNAEGWRGLFGIDVMKDIELNKLFLIEINARQPASTTFESFLQGEFRRQGIQGLTVFEAHLKALRGEPVGGPLIPLNDGAQIVQRVTRSVKEVPDDAVGSLELAGYSVIQYPNTEYNTDLLRIQSLRGIMEGHGKLNKRGKEIVELID